MMKINNDLLIVLAKFSWFWLRELPWSTRISTFLLWASTVSKKTSLQKINDLIIPRQIKY
jgi:hypothetical protein